jgi:hypothetical protein
LAVAVYAQPDGALTNGDGWDYIRLGNPNDVATATRGGILFEGGGTDVDAAYQWMCAKANSGDFLVIRASGTAAYNEYIRGLCPALNSVATLIVTSRAGAQQPFVKDTISKAEALFIAGGDQANYINYYAGTPVAAAIDTLAGRGVPVGGASAGNAVLAQFGYQRLRELAEPGGAVTLQTQVEILGRAGALCETQFHGAAALQIVAGKQPADCGALQDAAYCQIRYLSPQALLVQTLAARYAREGLFQPFRRTRSERLRCFGHNGPRDGQDAAPRRGRCTLHGARRRWLA